MNFLNKYLQKNNVCYFNEPGGLFEQKYVALRKKEDRLYPDELVLKLPDVSSLYSHYKEWAVRSKSSQKIMSYLSACHPKCILDLGCGNGWFTHKMAANTTSAVLGLDVNEYELTQAARLFSRQNCQFVYGDIFDPHWPESFFDLIVLNSSIQYFSSLSKLLNRLLQLLVPGGEIHILDSPFYASTQSAISAKNRSALYYDGLNMSEMSGYYFHHGWRELDAFKYEVLYNPDLIWTKLQRMFFKDEPVFPWIRIKNQ